MRANLGYHFSMKGLQVIAGLAVLCLVLVPVGFAQINGVPSSVTSIGFGGHAGPHGTPPSVTSIGPKGLVPNNTQFPLPGTCCINPLFPSQATPGSGHHHGGDHSGHHHDHNLGFGYAYAVPYVPYYGEDYSADSTDEEPYNGGPTVFDRRGTGQPAPYQMGQYAVPPVTAPATQPQTTEPSDDSAKDQPQTVLVFKDGHQIEVSNYAIVGSTLYDLTPGHSRKVALADLNLPATSQQNDSRGVDFELPGSTVAN